MQLYMEYAVVKLGGKQYRVCLGDIIEVDRLNLKPKDEVLLDKVLLLVSDKSVSLGKPTINNAKVTARVLEHIKGEKIRVSKFKAKSKYRRVTGHRQELTRVKIEKIATS